MQVGRPIRVPTLDVGRVNLVLKLILLRGDVERDGAGALHPAAELLRDTRADAAEHVGRRRDILEVTAGRPGRILLGELDVEGCAALAGTLQVFEVAAAERRGGAQGRAEPGDRREIGCLFGLVLQQSRLSLVVARLRLVR